MSPEEWMAKRATAEQPKADQPEEAPLSPEQWMARQAEIRKLDEVVRQERDRATAQPPVSPEQWVQQKAAASSPELKRFYELQSEKSKYGFGDLLAPSAVSARGGVLASRSVPKDDVRAMGAGFKLTPEQSQLLVTLAPLWVAAPPAEEASVQDWALSALGRVGYAAADIPQFLAKKAFFDDENFRNALDDVRELGEGRMGAAEWAAYNFGPAAASGAIRSALGAAVKEVPRSLPRVAAAGIVGGAAQGLGASREGEELTTAAQGAALGAGLGVAAAGIGKLFLKMRGEKQPKVGDPTTVDKIPESTDELTLAYEKNNEADLTKIGNEAYAAAKPTEDIIESAVFERRGVTAEEADTIVENISPETTTLAKRAIADEKGKAASEVTNVEVADRYVRDKFDTYINDVAERDPTLATKVGYDEVRMQYYRRPATNDEIFEAIQSRGADYLRDDWRSTRWSELAESAAAQRGVQFRGDDAIVGKTVANAAGDRQFGFKVIDERTGKDTLKNFYAANTNSNKLTVDKDRFFAGEEGIKGIYKTAKKAKQLVKDMVSDEGLMYKALSTRNLELLPAEWRPTAEKVIRFFDSVKERANTVKGDDIQPLAIRTREDFGLPQKLVRPTDYVLKMKTKYAELQDTIASLSADNIKAISNKNVPKGMDPAVAESIRDFMRGVEIVRPTTKIQDAASLVKAYKEVTQTGGAGVKLHSIASTTMERTEAIPDFLREKNIFRLMDRYTSDTLKNVYLRQPLERLMKSATLLDKTGAKVEAAFVKRYVADMLGMRAFSMARLGQEVRTAFVNTLDTVFSKAIKDPVRREKAVRMVASFPEAMASLQYNIYPNVLGLNIRAHIAQLTQPLFKTAPELGGEYGYRAVARSYLTTTMQMMQTIKAGVGAKFGAGTLPPDVFAKLKALGLEPKSYTRENLDAIEKGLELTHGLSKANRAMSDFILKTYSSMDSLNRAATLNVSERIVRDLNNNVPGAVKAVSKMPLAVKRQIIEAKGNPAAQLKAIAVHLNSATQFNYSKAAISELGTIVGPFLSTFTKWPLATAGDIAADIRTKGIGRGSVRVLEKYGAVYAMASLADSLLYMAVTGDAEVWPDWKEAGPRWAKILGRSGFTGMTPIESLSPVVGMVLPTDKKDSLVKSPVVEALYSDLLQPVIEGDEDKMEKGFIKATTTFVPGGFVYTLLNKTAPAVFNDSTEW